MLFSGGGWCSKHIVGRAQYIRHLILGSYTARRVGYRTAGSQMGVSASAAPSVRFREESSTD
jgi:hypothetical protein